MKSYELPELGYDRAAHRTAPVASDPGAAPRQAATSPTSMVPTSADA